MEQPGHHFRRSDQKHPLRVGLLGCGTVGSEVARHLIETPPDGAILERVAVKDVGKPRRVPLPVGLLSDDALGLATDPDIDVVIELIGGLRPAHELIRHALAERKHVVTANKVVLAHHGASLRAAAASGGISLHYEGAVGGAIPIVRTLRSIASHDRVLSITGVLNGTTNLVLCEMERGATLAEALDRARTAGFAEADPSEDIEGIDAAAKLVIVGSLAFGEEVRLEDVSITGIGHFEVDAVRTAGSSRCRLKLVARASRRPDGTIASSVEPIVLDATHPLARLEGVDNGVILETSLSGQLALYGRGAGGLPTAASVMADLQEVIRSHARTREPAPRPLERRSA
jgi:homoserine dehydrogenase